MAGSEMFIDYITRGIQEVSESNRYGEMTACLWEFELVSMGEMTPEE